MRLALLLTALCSGTNIWRTLCMNKYNIWFLTPIIAVVLAIALLAVNNGTGLDGAARATAIVFWFLPTIIWLGFMSFANLRRSNFSKFIKFIVIAIWLVPSMPLSLMSLYGITLISETGFEILF